MTASLVKIGLSAATTAFALSLFAILAAALAARGSRPAFLVGARNALIVNFALVTLAAFTVMWSFVVTDFSVLYVAENANSRLPLLYRLTALWGAHEGSLLLWLWYLCLFSAIAVAIHWRSHPLSMPWIIATLAAVQAGFIGFIVFLSSPFREIFPAPPDGRDLNPLLQDPGLAFHPPLLYMGYVAFSVPFAFAIAALIRGHAGAEWVRAVRRWTLFAWAALTSGIMLGGYWAYYELGWGGYWAWDPVENASFLPWLTGTAFLHSIMAQDRRNMFHTWNVFLIVTTFALSLLGTFLVRSGVLTSVHSFAVDPGRGTYMLAFLAVVMVAGYGLVIWRAERLTAATQLESAWSREAMLLVNNLFLLAAAAVVLLGTLYPLIVEAVSGDRVTVGAPYFNKVAIPMLVAVVFLMGIGPVVPWRSIKARRLRDLLRWPALAALVALAVALLAGVREVIGIAAIGAVAFTLSATLLDFRRSVAAHRAVARGGWLSSTWRVMRNARQRYGGMIVHLGILVIAFGMLASGLFQQTVIVSLKPGESIALGPYHVTFRGVESVDGPNYRARAGRFDVSRAGVPVMEMRPEKRSYQERQMVTTEAAIASSLMGDLYLVLGDEAAHGAATVRGYWNPLILWLWVGWLVVLVGAAVAGSARLSAARTPAAAAVAQEQPA